jgi:hypothetical protein
VHICKIAKQIKVQVRVKIAECFGVREKHGQAVRWAYMFGCVFADLQEEGGGTCCAWESYDITGQEGNCRHYQQAGDRFQGS